ncbi:MAG: GtrA family protein [Microcella pacifica]|uniref:GtrA family protein n=1 Tax=Microcella pacifica TaxID=2591847 RepID=UPI0033150A63
MPILVGQLARFGAVGIVGLIVDIALFNLLRLTVLSPELIAEGPVIAKVISTSVAIAVNWIGSRYWSFRLERRRPAMRESFEFALVSVGGLLIAVGCLVVSRYVLGYTSLLADNIASNVIGLALGSAFRFVLYRTWVFDPQRVRPAQPADDPAS